MPRVAIVVPVLTIPPRGLLHRTARGPGSVPALYWQAHLPLVQNLVQAAWLPPDDREPQDVLPCLDGGYQRPEHLSVVRLVRQVTQVLHARPDGRRADGDRLVVDADTAAELAGQRQQDVSACQLELGVRRKGRLHTHPQLQSHALVRFGPPVPIPAAFWLMGSGLIGLIGFMRKRSNEINDWG